MPLYKPTQPTKIDILPTDDFVNEAPCTGVNCPLKRIWAEFLELRVSPSFWKRLRHEAAAEAGTLIHLLLFILIHFVVVSAIYGIEIAQAPLHR